MIHFIMGAAVGFMLASLMAASSRRDVERTAETLIREKMREMPEEELQLLLIELYERGEKK